MSAMNNNTDAYIIEPERQVPIAGKYHVCVAGGGPAGVAAALSAARNGAKTCLLEAGGCLGGIWTSGLLAWFLDANDKGGIMGEIIEKMEERGARGHWPSGRPDNAFDVEELKELLESLCIEAGVEIHLHTSVTGANVVNSRLRHAITESKSGRLAYEARMFVDCTGDGDLGALAGNRFDYGNPETGLAQPMSLVAMIAGVNMHQVSDYFRVTGESTESWGAAKERFRHVMERGGHSPSYAFPTLMPVRDDLYLLMTNHEYGYCGFKETDLTAATLDARREINRIVNGLRSLGGIWSNLRLVSTGDKIGVREGRRLRGKYVVNVQDMIDGARFDDAVCRANFGADVHSTNPNHGKGIAKSSIHTKPYDIPMRSLIAADVDGLMMAGRCISGDFIAHSSYRVTGNAVAMGEAAGKEAARLSSP